jgi:flavorubredoxin
MAKVTEIAPDVYRISVYVNRFDLGFNHFLVKDEESLLFHTGMRGMHRELREAVATILEPSKIRWIGFSHFEADECGALNEWLAEAPRAQAIASPVGAMVNLSDFAIRPPRGLEAGEALATGRHRFRFLSTPHRPHGWDSGFLFEETEGTLFSSDLLHQGGDVEPTTGSDLIDRVRATLLAYQAGPLMDYLPWTPKTGDHIEALAALKPRTIAAMHGSTFLGDGAQALRDLGGVLREVFGGR